METIPARRTPRSAWSEFNDTPIVNGTAYRRDGSKAYRCESSMRRTTASGTCSGHVADSTGTEVALKAAEVEAGRRPGRLPTPDLPHLAPAGPSWIQIEPRVASPAQVSPF